MKKPILFLIDDDPQVLRAIQRDLRNHFKQDYRIISTESALEALATLKELKLKGEVTALFLSDQRMPEMLGVELLDKAKEIYPEAKRVLLTAYSDTDAAIRAINEVQLDYYLLKPWDPPEEKLYPVLDDLLDDWKMNYRPEFEGLRIVGYQWSPKSHEIKDFLAGNLKPYQWLDIETNPKAQEMLELIQAEKKDLPVVLFEDGSHLISPNLAALGERIGLKSQADSELYDVTIIGAGPAGLAAAVYGGSEGLKTLLIEKRAPGGQAGTSSRIENYLGFPSGLSGADLARRAITQAQRFGIEFLSPQEVIEIKSQDQYKTIKLLDGTEIHTRSIVITTGVDYRRLDTKGLEQFTGAGVYYGAATTEAQACKNQDVYIVGGGNSAGQAAMYLAKFARNVFIVIRKEDLSSSMSQYLIDQIAGTPNIQLLPKTEVVEALGKERLEELVIEHIETKELQKVPAGSLFIFIGAKPYTDWVNQEILKNDKGFVKTGRDLLTDHHFKKIWKKDREPFLLETSVPGIFAAGDVRSGAMNRVASAVGEGAMAIKFVHEYLAEN
ncbi:MAG: FAD-dependent oxidoreductase [Microscillaceae bacterium]|nr:FAD-dependent oxidoreductase [Microscillaceae bacterium]